VNVEPRRFSNRRNEDRADRLEILGGDKDGKLWASRLRKVANGMTPEELGGWLASLVPEKK
jgi:hypothetical protein